MRELGGGSIVNLSSIAWLFGGADFTAYATAKAAVVGLTNALARAFGPTISASTPSRRRRDDREAAPPLVHRGERERDGCSAR